MLPLILFIAPYFWLLITGRNLSTRHPSSGPAAATVVGIIVGALVAIAFIGGAVVMTMKGKCQMGTIKWVRHNCNDLLSVPKDNNNSLKSVFWLYTLVVCGLPLVNSSTKYSL